MLEAGENSFNHLVKQHLGRGLPEGMASAVSMGNLSVEARSFIERMLSLMKQAQYPVTNFNPPLLRWVSEQVPNILPGAWGGRVPPITVPGRHGKLDVYVAGKKQFQQKDSCTFLDIGCGFPPVTTADTANFLSSWRVTGNDISFAEYVLYDSDKNYACFDVNGEFLYFQGLMNEKGRQLYVDPEKTRNCFKTIFNDLYRLLPQAGGRKSQTIAKNGNLLVRHHIRDFETDNLFFIESDMERLDIPPVQVMRCMNLLIYYPVETRTRMLLRVGEHLDDDGILIAGTNGLGIQQRYTVYEKNGKSLYPGEFAFSLDNLGPITFMAWFTIHEYDPEALLLVHMSKVIRQASGFWRSFSNRVDQLIETLFSCSRDPDGFFQFPVIEGSPVQLAKISSRLWNRLEREGFCDGAVEVLQRAGYDAWKNEAGDIAVKPPDHSGLL